MEQGRIEFKVFPEYSFVWFFGRGRFSYEYLMERIADVNAHPDFDPTFSSFIDFADAKLSYKDGGFNQYMAFFNKHQSDAPPRRWAIYTANRETFTNAQMAQLLESGSINVQVFEEREEALTWLGVPEPAGL